MCYSYTGFKFRLSMPYLSVGIIPSKHSIAHPLQGLGDFQGRVTAISPDTNNCLTVLKLYMAPIRPHLEYATQVWNPYLVKDINSLERVQKFALRICSKGYHVT